MFNYWRLKFVTLLWQQFTCYESYVHCEYHLGNAIFPFYFKTYMWQNNNKYIIITHPLYALWQVCKDSSEQIHSMGYFKVNTAVGAITSLLQYSKWDMYMFLFCTAFCWFSMHSRHSPLSWKTMKNFFPLKQIPGCHLLLHVVNVAEFYPMSYRKY